MQDKILKVILCSILPLYMLIYMAISGDFLSIFKWAFVVIMPVASWFLYNYFEKKYIASEKVEKYLHAIDKLDASIEEKIDERLEKWETSKKNKLHKKEDLKAKQSAEEDEILEEYMELVNEEFCAAPEEPTIKKDLETEPKIEVSEEKIEIENEPVIEETTLDSKEEKTETSFTQIKEEPKTAEIQEELLELFEEESPVLQEVTKEESEPISFDFNQNIELEEKPVKTEEILEGTIEIPSAEIQEQAVTEEPIIVIEEPKEIFIPKPELPSKDSVLDRVKNVENFSDRLKCLSTLIKYNNRLDELTDEDKEIITKIIGQL